ncbi:MAG: glycosyltransferase family 2 protein [Ruminococcus sp.]|nr:glycosyltransferase family 2 protein [Ruminococcus sp.]
MIITVGVIAYNEKNSMGSLLKDICKQTYDHKKIEVILVDSNSTDNTKVIMETFKKNNQDDFYGVQVLSNPKKTQPCGWNVVLNHYNGDAVVRIDAHASIPSDFIQKNVSTLLSGENICGGFRPNIIDERTPWKETLNLVETSMFGSSIAPYRRQQGKTYVNSLFHGAYRRRVFDKVGLFNENLVRTEDNEIHYRMKKAGFKICFNPEIISYQHTRNNLKGMIKQKYGNGRWIGLTLSVAPKCLSYYHFVPFLFVVSLIFCTIFALLGFPLLIEILLLLYSMFDFVNTVSCFTMRDIKPHFFLLPLLFPIMHLAYGFGTLMGVLQIPFWKKSLKKKKEIQE